jgi:hypothetical protein
VIAGYPARPTWKPPSGAASVPQAHRAVHFPPVRLHFQAMSCTPGHTPPGRAIEANRANGSRAGDSSSLP